MPSNKQRRMWECFCVVCTHNARKCLPSLDVAEGLSGVGSGPAQSSAPPQWDAMKLSLMIEEANAIGKKLRKHTIFSR